MPPQTLANGWADFNRKYSNILYIINMNTHVEKTEELKEEIKRLNRRIDVLSRDLNRLAKSNFESNEVIRKHLGLIDRDQENASSRIKNLELKTFPDLAKDIVQLHDIIGDGEDKSDNPLDRRKP